MFYNDSGYLIDSRIYTEIYEPEVAGHFRDLSTTTKRIDRPRLLSDRSSLMNVIIYNSEGRADLSPCRSACPLVAGNRELSLYIPVIVTNNPIYLTTGFLVDAA